MGVRLHVSPTKVGEFARRWPCFGPVRAMWFEFAANGDLVDLHGDKGCDGLGVSALASDTYAKHLRKQEFLKGTAA